MTNLIAPAGRMITTANSQKVRERVSAEAAFTYPAIRLLADVRELAPDIVARTAETESGRRIPLDLGLALIRTHVPNPIRRQQRLLER